MNARRPAALTSAAAASASACERLNESATFMPRRASSTATAAPILFPPVMTAARLVSSALILLCPTSCLPDHSQLLADWANQQRPVSSRRAPRSVHGDRERNRNGRSPLHSDRSPR